MCASRGIIFLWLGYMAEPLHKRHASRILEMKKENNNVRVIIVEDGYEQTLRDEDRRVLDEILDPVNRSVAPERNSANYAPSPIKLYKCTEQSNKYKVAEIKSGPIFRPDLASDSVFLLDRGEAGVWAWVGKSVDIKEKLEAVRNARGFIKKKGYSTNVPVARAIEGQEPPEIKCLLRGWETTKPRPLTLPSSFEPDYMNERPKISAECQLVDDGRGDRITWRVNHSGELLEIEDNGVYYAESCYILQYRYGSGRRCKTIVCFTFRNWLSTYWYLTEINEINFFIFYCQDILLVGSTLILRQQRSCLGSFLPIGRRHIISTGESLAG